MATLKCENCQQQLQIADDLDGLWLTCPHCLTKIMNPNRMPDSRPRLVDVSRPDTEARMDSSGTIVCLVVFGILVLAGLVMLFSGDNLRLLTSTTTGTQMLVLIVVFIVLIVGGTMGLIIFGKGTSTKVLATTLGSVGLAAVGALIVVVLICAGIANFFQTCASCGKPNAPPKAVR